MEPKILVSDIAEVMGCSIHNVHMLIKERNVKTRKESNRVFITNPEELKKLTTISIPKKKISIHTSKGGVGKTSITLQIAIRMWLYGARVLIIDLDQQGNLTKHILKGDKPGSCFLDVLEGKISINNSLNKIFKDFDLIGSSIKNSMLSNYMIAYGLSPENTIKETLGPIEENYDIIIFDCPPAVGHIISSAVHYSNLIISPIDPDEDAVDGMEQCWNEVNKINKITRISREFRIILNKYDQRTIMSASTLDKLKRMDSLRECLYETIIGVSQEFPLSKKSQLSLYDTPRQGKGAKDIDEITKEILGIGNA